jgi:hypothetical protein
MDLVGSNWIKLDQIRSNWIKLDQIDMVLINMDKRGLDKHGLTHMILSNHVLD